MTRILTALGLMATLAAGAGNAAEPGVLTLVNGDSVSGRFQAAESPERVRWQGAEFTRPFEFASNVIQSVRFPPVHPAAKARGQFAFELAKEDVLTGRIVRWSDESVEIETPHFGRVHIRREAVRRMCRIDDNPTLVFTGLSGLGDWRTDSLKVAPLAPVNNNRLTEPKVAAANAAPSAPLWREEGVTLWSDQDMAMLSGELGVPDKAVVEFELAWTGKPNFVLALACDPGSKVDKRQDGWRFEVWDDLLAIVREQSRDADVDQVLAFDDKTTRVQLTAYLDQQTGRMDVFLPDGKAAGKLVVPPALADVAPGAKGNNPPAKPGTGVRLINRRGTLRLERLRIARWNGVLPSTRNPGDSQFGLVDGSAVRGKLLRFDEAAQQFVLETTDGEATVPLQRIITAELASDFAGGERSISTLLQDGTRVSGRIGSYAADAVTITSPEVTEPMRIPYEALRSVTNSDRGKIEAAAVKGRDGRLEIGDRRLAGRLVPNTADDGSSSLAWHPLASRTASPMKPEVAGRIVYRAFVQPAATAQSVPQAQGVVVLGRRNVTRMVAAGPPGPETPTIHLRSGDNIPCTITAIDEQGVTIATSLGDPRVVPHARIKAAELVARAAPPKLRDAKKQRLLTLPRLQKASPPTHLLCSKSGDFLRCRILSLTDESVRVEVQLAEMEIPRNRIAQIVWFHPDELNADEKASGAKTSATNTGDAAIAELPPALVPRLAQALWHDGRRVTFTPEQVDGQHIIGASEIVGPCRFKIDEIDELIFGGQIEEAAALLTWNQWRLHPAVEPLVAQDLGNDPGVAGPESPLVGKPAPEIELTMLDGKTFKLSACKGQIVILDFWASWCGPCMRTMPLVEEAVREFDPERVRLVSVNLEETASQIQGVLERQKLNVAVALDVDGVAARRYEANAIPQLVVVDPEGKIAQLYVGGGPQVVERLKGALNDLLKASGASTKKPDEPAGP